jgi:hypothetical protein
MFLIIFFFVGYLKKTRMEINFRELVTIKSSYESLKVQKALRFRRVHEGTHCEMIRALFAGQKKRGE